MGSKHVTILADICRIQMVSWLFSLPTYIDTLALVFADSSQTPIIILQNFLEKNLAKFHQKFRNDFWKLNFYNFYKENLKINLISHLYSFGNNQ